MSTHLKQVFSVDKSDTSVTLENKIHQYNLSHCVKCPSNNFPLVTNNVYFLISKIWVCLNSIIISAMSLWIKPSIH